MSLKNCIVTTLLLLFATNSIAAIKLCRDNEIITLIKNNRNLLPLKRLDTLKIASLNFGGKEINEFQIMTAKYAPILHLVTDDKLNENELGRLQKQLASYNCILIYNTQAAQNPDKKSKHPDDLIKLIQTLKGKRMILCHPAAPAGLSEYLDLPLESILISYENHTEPQQLAAQAIFGGFAMTGKLTSEINLQYPSGFGLQTKKTRLGYTTPENCGIASNLLSEIDSICKTAIKTGATPGCQVLIAKDGMVIYNKAFGYNTYKKQIPNHTSNIYDLASLTKITATLPAVMKLYDQKKIKLDAPLSEYLSPLKRTNKKHLTVREILCHNAGLKTFIPFLADAIDKKSISGPLFTKTATKENKTKLQEKLYVNLKYQFSDSTISNHPKPDYDFMSPGLYVFHNYHDTILKKIYTSPLNKKKEYVYSDLGFILLKYAVEQITQESFDQFCQETFYKKLGANHTDFLAIERLNPEDIVPSCVDELYRKSEIRGTVHDPGAAVLGGIAGHAGLFSTAEDLAKIMQLYLNKGTYGGEYFFSPETIETFTRKNTMFPSNRRALGFDKPETDKTKPGPTCPLAPDSSFGHTGFTGTMAWCDPEHHLTYIFLSNRTYPNEFNTKLSEENIRTKIQEIIYKAIIKSTTNKRLRVNQ